MFPSALKIHKREFNTKKAILYCTALTDLWKYHQVCPVFPPCPLQTSEKKQYGSDWLIVRVGSDQLQEEAYEGKESVSVFLLLKHTLTHPHTHEVTFQRRAAFQPVRSTTPIPPSQRTTYTHTHTHTHTHIPRAAAAFLESCARQQDGGLNLRPSRYSAASLRQSWKLITFLSHPRFNFDTSTEKNISGHQFFLSPPVTFPKSPKLFDRFMEVFVRCSFYSY